MSHTGHPQELRFQALAAACAFIAHPPKPCNFATANAKHAKFRCETPRTLRTPRLQLPRTFQHPLYPRTGASRRPMLLN